MRICVVLMLLGGLARADDAALAKEHFEKGSRLYDIGQYKEAAAEYAEAYKLKPDPSLLFNMGQAYRLGGFYEEALRSYRSFLRRMPKVPQRREIETHINDLTKLVEQQRKASTRPPLDPVQPPPVVETKPPEPSPAPLVVQPPPPAPASAATPVYKKWWLWTAVGVVVAAGVGVGFGLGYGLPKDAPIPSGAYTVSFR
jgi:tetratricopeptide (TPR) repeat protein